MIAQFFIPVPFDLGFKLSVRVTSDGEFTASVPGDVAKLFDDRKITLQRSPRGKSGYIVSDTLAGLREKMKALITVLCSEKEISRAKVIRYAVDTACGYGIDPDGDFTPYPPLDSEGHYEWHHGTLNRNATERGPFGIMIFAQPCEKVTYRYEATGQERIQYDPLRIHQFDGDIQKDMVQWLCQIPSQAASTGHFGGESLAEKEVPCTDSTLRFFVGLMKGIFALNEKIKPFLHPEGIIEMADRQTPLLGAAPQ